MIDVLLERIKFLEKQLEDIEKKNSIVKEKCLELFKSCRIEKDKKDRFKKEFLNVVLKLNIRSDKKFFNGDLIDYSIFTQFIDKLKDYYLVIISCPSDKIKCDVVSGFIINKFNSFFTKYEDMLIGVIDNEHLEELKNIKSIPFYNPSTKEFDDIEIFKMIFEKEEYSIKSIEKAKKIFKDFRLRPSYKNKHFIEYSLSLNSVIDFEREKINKQKAKYLFIYDETYPNLEPLLKKNIDKLPFVLTLLERIDKELEHIKTSKGLTNIVNRMLNSIDLEYDDENIKEMVRYLRVKLNQ